jgi:tetratricopeptide (TPR) repeat protein
MRGARVLLVVSLAVTAGCRRYVVKVETEPAGGRVTLNGAPGKGDRFAVAAESAAEVAATWPDGQRMATALVVDRDMHVLLRRDGDPSQVIGARPIAGVAPAPAPAPAPTPAPAAPAAQGDPMTRAKALAEAGQKAYELTDYDVAIARFKEAYELIRSSKDPKAPEILGNILFNLAVVYERSYEVTPDLERLRRARIMYKQFDEQMAALVEGWSASAEHADVLSRLRALDARIGGK